MLNDREIAWSAALAQSTDKQTAEDAITMLISSTVQAIHSIARSLEMIAGPAVSPCLSDTDASRPYGDRS